MRTWPTWQGSGIALVLGILILFLLAASGPARADIFGLGGDGLPDSDTGAPATPPGGFVIGPIANPAPGTLPAGISAGGGLGGGPAPAASSTPSTTATTSASTGYIRIELGQATKNRVAELERRLAQHDQKLLEELMARERARYTYEHGGGFASDHQEFLRRQQRIVQLQNSRISTLGELGREIVKDKPEQREKVQRAWEKAKADHLATLGLKQSKFVNADERTSPSNPREVSKWLHNPQYQHQWVSPW